MAFQDMLNAVTTILNRDDCTPAQAQVFLTQALERIQREVRLPSMERQQLITATATMDWFPVPSDLLQPIDILEPGQYDLRPTPLQRLPFRRLMRMDPNGWPTAYARFQGQFWVRGQVPAGSLVQCLYYGAFTPFATAASENELSLSSPDLAVYGALSFAGDQFQHPLTPTWEGRYQQILASVTQAAEDVDGEGGPQQIEPLARDGYEMDYWT